MADSNITKRALASSLKELMETMPFEKINVGDICEKCDMEVKFDDHNFIGDCGDGCRICGYENKNGHIYEM